MGEVRSISYKKIKTVGILCPKDKGSKYFWLELN